MHWLEQELAENGGERKGEVSALCESLNMLYINEM